MALTSAVVMAGPAPMVGAAPARQGCPGSRRIVRSTLADTAIPDLGTATSTIVVSGADPYLWNVEVKTFITHEFSADLDVTVRSPRGTVVTLTTDNGGGFAGVFNGTVWADDANPSGDAPYSPDPNFQPGIVTDHPYSSGVVASPLVPEESLDAFQGENPNGAWTLTIHDDDPGVLGSLTGWSLDLVTLPAAGLTEPVTFTPPFPVSVEIPSGAPNERYLTMGIDAPFDYIADVDVRTFLAHDAPGDIDMVVAANDGLGNIRMVTLSTDNGGSDHDVFDGTVWDDDANPGGQVPYSPGTAYNAGLVTDHLYSAGTVAARLVPEESLGAFKGGRGLQEWYLFISDDSAGNGGMLTGWSVTLRGLRCAPGVPSGVSVTPGNTSATVRWTAPTGTVGTPIVSYTARAMPGGRSCTAMSSCRITGLKNGTSYSVTVTAANDTLSGAASAARTVTPRTKPGPPRSVRSTSGNKELTVRWKRPTNNGGAAITRYTATATPGGRTCTVKAKKTSCAITKLKNGTSYTVTVKARNAAGVGKASQPAPPVAPSRPV